MTGPERPPPPITVVVPGRETPAEVMESGPRVRPSPWRDGPPPLPGRSGALLLLVVAVLVAGVLVALDPPVRSPARSVTVADVPSLGLSAQVGLVAEEPFSTLLDVEVVIPPGDPGAGPTPEEPAPQLKLMEVSGRGLAVRLTRAAPPLLLGHLGRFASATERVLHLSAEVVAGDCRTPAAVAPAILLVVQRADGAPDTVEALGDAVTSRALLSLVRRTCRTIGG